MKTVFGLTCIFLFSSLSNSLLAITYLDIKKESQKINLSPYLEYLEEGSKSLSIKDISSWRYKNKFKRVKDVNFGFARRPFWVRFSLRNSSKRPLKRLLEIGFPFLDHIELYEPDGKGSFNIYRTGRATPFYTREIKHRNFLFRIKIPSGSSSYFVRIDTESAMYFPMTLWTEETFWKSDHEAQFALGLYYGIMLVMALYNLFIFISLRDRAYLFYVIYIVSFALYQMTANGLAYEYLWPNWVWWNRNSTLFLAGVAMIWATFFTKDFLLTQRSVPFLDRVLNWIVILAIILSFFSLIISYGIMLKITLFVAAIFVTFLLLSGLICLKRGQKSARFYIMAWFALLSGVMILILWNIGWLPSRFWSIYSIQFGSVMDVVLLSLALADRINELRNARESALRQVMEERARAHEQREEMVRELHDGIGAIATNISLLAQRVKLKSPSYEVEEDLETISQLATRGRMEISSFMECLDEGDQEAKEFINDLRYLGNQLLSGNGIAFSLKDMDSEKDIRLSPFLRLNVTKIFQEAITNCLKHSEASSVKVKIEIKKEGLFLSISDNGKGINLVRGEALLKGRGLSNMRKRVKRLGGTIEIKNQEGSEIILKVPILHEAHQIRYEDI